MFALEVSCTGLCVEPHQSHIDRLILHLQERDTDRQAEPPGARTAWVDEEDPVPLLDRWVVGVAADHDSDARRFGHEVEVLEIMNDGMLRKNQA
jgi:hypothetical protein